MLGIAIAVIPFLLRMRQGQYTQKHIKEFEEGEQEEKKDKKKDSSLWGEGVIGMVEIPDLHIKYPIFEGTGNTQLNAGIGHMTESAGLCGKGKAHK